MYSYEFQILAMLFVANFGEVLDLTTTWFYMRLSGKPFEVVESNQRMRRLGFRKSGILGLILMSAVTVIFFLYSLWLFQLSPDSQFILPVLWLVLCLYKFETVINNFFRKIRRFIEKEKG